MKRMILLIAIVAMLCACGMSDTYNSENYPDSIIIKAFENAKVNPEVFSQRILRVIRDEIAYGRFSREDVTSYVDGKISMLKAGELPYVMIRDIIEKYGRELLLPDGDNASEAAIIAYYLFMPDLDMLDVPLPVGEKDTELALLFLTYIRDGV